MRQRWQFLLGSLLALLAGVAWFARRISPDPAPARSCFGPARPWFLEPVSLALIAATILVVACAATGKRERWPAALTLGCVAPWCLGVLVLTTEIPELLRYGVLGPYLLMSASLLGTLAGISRILFAPPTPPPSDEPVPRARLV